MKIIELVEVDSTNEYCKRIDNGEDLIVTAVRQSAGKGTKGRSFISDDGGLYVTVMRHYPRYGSAFAFKIMINACVAVCSTLEEFGLSPVIRWANDVLINGRKICGTLIENTFSGSDISRSVVGIGLNINNALPDELSSIATSMRAELKCNIDIERVRNVLIDKIQKGFTVEDYKKYINWFGMEVVLKTSSGEKNVIANDVDGYGNLIVDDNGEILKISSAEVSLRL